MKTLFIALLLSLGMTACTKGASDDSPSIPSIIGDIIGNTPPSTTQAAEKQVKDIQASLNQDSNYQLTAEDQDLLASESLIDDKSELKSWVK